MKRLENRLAIITGGADGLGKAGVIKFLEEGATVIFWDVNKEKAQQTLSELNGKAVEFMYVNTADFASVEKATSDVLAKYGKIDILVNNAGITRDATLKKMTTQQWQQVLDVNLTGVFNCTKIISEGMVEKGYGKIINTSSVVALYGNFGQTNYVATKAGLIGMTKTWAKELGRKGINVNAVAPGFILTDMVKAMPQKVTDMMQEKVPLGRLGQPEDIANAYLFLASEEASYINGIVLSVDGGMVI